MPVSECRRAGFRLSSYIRGFDFRTSVNVQNLLDTVYFEGGTIASPGRQLFITNSLRF
jgi:hypothetical protein